jgi:hypothetical protein
MLMKRLGIVLGLALALVAPAAAQDVVPSAVLTLTADAPQEVALSAAAPVWLRYTADAPQRITVVVQGVGDSSFNGASLGATADVVVDVLTDELHMIAYNDDHQAQAADVTELAPNDAVLADLVVAAGVYYLRVDSFSGLIAGSARVRLTRQLISETRLELPDIGTSRELTISLSRNQDVSLLFDGPRGATLTISARDVSGTLDPHLLLLNQLNTFLIANDDHASADTSLNALDAQINAFTLSEQGTYTLHVGDFLGRRGRLLLTITRVG